MALGFWKIAQEDPERVALITPGDEVEVTYGELHAGANRVANGLQALGLQKGDTVACVLPNGLEMVELAMATLQIGLYLTPINHHLVGPEIAYIVDDSDAKIFIGHERFADELAKAATEIELPSDAWYAVGDVEGFRPYAELTAGQPDTPPANRAAGAPMHYTSGTTGKPKGVKRQLVELDPDTYFELFTGFPQMFGWEPHGDGVHIVGSPLYHTAVLQFGGSALHMGHKVVLMDKWGAEDMLRLIDEHKVTSSHMVPTQFVRMLALPEEVRAKYDMSSTRNMIHAAAPCPPDVKRQMIEWWGDSIWEYYAATEGGGTIITAKEWMEKPGSVGKAWSNSEVFIIGDDGTRLGPNEIGTVYMKMGVEFEYKGDPEKTKDSHLSDGSFTVGDIGEIDEDGYLFLRDRKSHMIISGGVNIYPAEIESTLITHPAVADVAVFGIPHDDWGEEVKAVLELEDGYEQSDELIGEIAEFARENLAKLKVPRTFDVVDQLPRDPNGKLYKKQLRDPYWEGRDSKI